MFRELVLAFDCFLFFAKKSASCFEPFFIRHDAMVCDGLNVGIHMDSMFGARTQYAGRTGSDAIFLQT